MKPQATSRHGEVEKARIDEDGRKEARRIAERERRVVISPEDADTSACCLAVQQANIYTEKGEVQAVDQWTTRGRCAEARLAMRREVLQLQFRPPGVIFVHNLPSIHSYSVLHEDCKLESSRLILDGVDWICMSGL